MDKQRSIFYGLIVGFTLMIFPIPYFFFWDGVMDIVKPTFHYIGFFIFIICAVLLTFDLFKVLFKNK